MSYINALREALVNLKQGQIIPLENKSRCVQAREVAREMNIPIVIKAQADRYLLSLKRNKMYSAFEQKAYSGYNKKPKQWELKITPVGKSGIPRESLAYYSAGHDKIPDDWYIYAEEYDLIFKVKNVINPKDLLNDKLISLGLKPTRIFLDINLEPLSAIEQEKRFNELRNIQID